MTHDEIIEMLKDDDHYYGDFGKQFLSNSDVGKLINNPSEFHKDSEPNINFLIGGAFHTMILEPHKMDQYKIVDAPSRRGKAYKDNVEEGEMALIPKDIDLLTEMAEVLAANDEITDVLNRAEKEVPMVMEICGEWWKGKADAVNHEDKLIIDLKTTSNIANFKASASKFNYDSQAFIYRQLFGYDFAFVVIDKKTLQTGFFNCSDDFYKSGREKVIEAVHSYRMHFKNNDEEPDFSNYLIVDTL